MAGIPVNNNLNAFSRTVNRTAGTQGNQPAPYGSASYTAKQEEVLKDSFDMVMGRVNSQAKASADTPDGSRRTGNEQSTGTQTAAKATVAPKTTAGSRTISSDATAESAKQGTEKSGKAADAESGKTAETEANDKVSDTVEEKAVEEGTVEEVSENDVSTEQKDAVTEAGEKLVEAVAGEMGVTPEEVLEAMEMLGLSAVQLLDPDNMKQLLVAISGNEDPLSIITDGELYSHLQNLLNTVSESLNDLQSELGLSGEELEALIAEVSVAENESEAVEIPEDLVMIPEEAEVSDVSEVSDISEVSDVSEGTETPEGMKDYAVTVHRDGEEVKVKVQVEDGGANKSVREEVTQVSEVQNRHEAKPDNKEAFGDNRESFGDNRGESSAQNNFMMQTPVEQPVLNETAAGQTVMERFTSTEDIMNQITEYIKINLKSDVQEMELQLHPASLGSVNVQLASKDGVITAQFTAQNETVKAAIESQLVQLKTQFEEQGIKVDAVEVTVANYRFDQNFSGKEENPEEGNRNGKKGHRRINLNDMSLEELPEDMEDSERIAAEMMARNGNTVDYTA